MAGAHDNACQRRGCTPIESDFRQSACTFSELYRLREENFDLRREIQRLDFALRITRDLLQEYQLNEKSVCQPPSFSSHKPTGLVIEGDPIFTDTSSLRTVPRMSRTNPRSTYEDEVEHALAFHAPQFSRQGGSASDIYFGNTSPSSRRESQERTTCGSSPPPSHVTPGVGFSTNEMSSGFLAAPTVSSASPSTSTSSPLRPRDAANSFPSVSSTASPSPTAHPQQQSRGGSARRKDRLKFALGSQSMIGAKSQRQHEGKPSRTSEAIRQQLLQNAYDVIQNSGGRYVKR
ncbi:uncharacterized protein [Diadema setosum]